MSFLENPSEQRLFRRVLLAHRLLVAVAKNPTRRVQISAGDLAHPAHRTAMAVSWLQERGHLSVVQGCPQDAVGITTLEVTLRGMLYSFCAEEGGDWLDYRDVSCILSIMRRAGVSTLEDLEFQKDALFPGIMRAPGIGPKRRRFLAGFRSWYWSEETSFS